MTQVLLDENVHACNEAEDELNMIPDRTSVKDMILRFEKSAATNNEDTEEYVDNRKKTISGGFYNLVNPLQIHLNHLSVSSSDRNSSVSVNSILSGISEASFESNSSGFVSDRKTPVPHRPAPPPPAPFNDDYSSPSRSPVPEETLFLHEKRLSLQSPSLSPILLRRVRQPPVIRRKSSLSNQSYQGETHWSYGVRQSDLEKLLRLKTSEVSDNEEVDIENVKVTRREYKKSEDSNSSDNIEEDDGCSINDEIRTETLSTDQSTDTLINENDGSDVNDNNYEGSDGVDNLSDELGGSGDQCSNFDNVSIKSISSFDNMVPYQQYDSITVSSDEFGSEACHAPDNEYLTVSAVNEWCVVSKSIKPVLIPVETKKEKYKRRLTERVNELIHTEAVYVDRVGHVVNNYVSEMTRPDLPIAIRGLKPEIFANIERIHRFHAEEFLPALRDCENDLRKLGQCFRSFEMKFNMYVMYSRNNKRATRLVYEHKKFFQEKQHELGDRLDLSSYLLEPVQRIPRYKLFLDDLVKTYTNYENERCESETRISSLSADSDETGGSNGESTDSEETPLESLKQAKTMIECVLTAIDGIMALENIKECPLNLLNQGQLLRQGEFIVMDYAKRRRQQMHVFLFDKVVLLTAVFRKQLTIEEFLYRDHIPVEDLGITAKDHDKYKFSIWYRKRNLKSYKLETRDSSLRTAWVNEIEKLLWDQANKTKELIQQNRNIRISVVSMNSDDSGEGDRDKYNSLRGVPGEVRRSGEKKFRRTTWYCE